MRNRDGSNSHRGRDVDDIIDRTQGDVAVIDQLSPWRVRRKKRRHTRRGMNGEGLRGCGLSAEVDQPGVVAHMGMSEQDPIEDR